MQQRVASLQPGIRAACLLKHALSKAQYLHQPVQPFGGNKIQRRLLAAAAGYNVLQKVKQWLEVRRLEVLAQACAHAP